MPVYAKNPRSVSYEIPELLGPVTLAAAGTDGSVQNVTSELRGLTNVQYAALQVEVLAGKVSFNKTNDITYTTPGLEIPSSSAVFDDSTIPRASTATPASPVYFDSLGQPFKSIEIDSKAGAFQLDVFGSIDCACVDMASKAWRYLGTIYGSDPRITPIPPTMAQDLRKYRFTQFNLVRGTPPKIRFLSSM